MHKEIKSPYQTPELRIYGTLRELTLTASGGGIDYNPNCSAAPHHVSASACP